MDPPEPDDHRPTTRTELTQLTMRWERGDEPEFGRFAFFADAVFAIALTLLVLDVRVPVDLPDASDPSTMIEQFGDLVPQFVAFGVAFIMIGHYWMAHHAFVGTLGAVDRPLMGTNLVYLAFVAFLPFPSALIGEHEDNPISVVAFWTVLAVISTLETVLMAQAHRRGLMRIHLPPEVFRYWLISSMQPVAMFLVLIPVAFWSPTVALLGPIVISPAAGALQGRWAPDSVGDFFPRHRNRGAGGTEGD